VIESEPFGEGEAPAAEPAAAPSSDESENGDASRDRSWRGRRRRRGRRGDRNERSERSDRTERSPSAESREPRYSRQSSEASSSRDDFGPPPGYEPIILPGESISKYQRRPQGFAPAISRGEVPRAAKEPQLPEPISATFPEDEPLFAANQNEPLHEQHGDEIARQEWEREHALQERMHLNTLFSEPSQVEDLAEPIEEDVHISAEVSAPEVTAHFDMPEASAGTLEHEEIDEEEADIASYVEELEEDATFEELEEETRAAEEHGHPHEIAAQGEGSIETVEFVEESSEFGDVDLAGAPIEAFTGEPVSVEEGTEETEEEVADAEIEDAQAEAEALLEAEARGNGTVDARVEMRAPTSSAGYMQRPQRQGSGFDRRRGRRGGRRFRSGGPRRENTPVPQITDLLKEGQEVLIQIAKEPIGKKGARITSHIALPGRFLVYMPTVNHTGVSRKINSEEERMRLKRIVISERENGVGGFIVRTAAAGASEEELRADIRFLKGLWNEIKGRSDESKAPALIYHDLNVVERVLRDQVTSDFSAIWVDTETEYERILRFANRFQPALVRRVKLYTKETPLFEQFGLKEEVDKALKSKVWLKSGGYIVINQTEALVAIDVNTGKYVGKTARLEDTIVKTNVDAIKEIVRQIRLRDLGGIIVIDFIDMDERRNRQKVMQALEEELRNDRAPSKVLQFNDFGLVAITRKRVKQSLERTIGAPCPYCQSTGFVKSITTVCNEIYVEMRKIAKHLEHADVMLRVNPDVAKQLKVQNGRWLSEMEELTKRTIIVKSDPTLHMEQFDIN